MSTPGRGAALTSLFSATTAAILVAALGLDLSMTPGPWQQIAAFAGAATLLSTIVTLTMLRRVVLHSRAMSARASIAEFEQRKVKTEIQRLTDIEDTLTQSQYELTSAVKAKDEFLAMMSHEIRTSLNGITPTLELLSRSSLNAEQQQLVETATVSSQGLLRIVDDILDYSKLKSNKFTLENIAFDLSEVLEQTIQLMQPAAQKCGLNLVLQLDSSVEKHLYGDPLRLRQVLTNLINNAIKFTHDGAITLAVNQTVLTTGNQEQLRFEVRDTGIGIDAKTQTSLFKPFNQADASIARLFGGSGLGLTICQHIVGLMNGKIKVESQVGKGSNFWFEIPLVKATDEQLTSTSKASTTEHFAIADNASAALNYPPLAANNYRLLLVEDNPVNLSIIQKMLESLGLTADHASNGVDALEKMSRTHYSLVLMDCQMPRLDGYTATCRWRESETELGTKRLPILAMTANVAAGDHQRCLSAGMDDYLPKPITRDALKRSLIHWLQKSDTTTKTAAHLNTEAADEQKGDAHTEETSPPLASISAIPPAASNIIVLDTKTLDDLRQTVGTELPNVIRVFLSDASELISKLERASASLDLGTMCAVSHSLKSSSANLGALALSTAASRIELATREQHLSRPAVAVALVIAEFARARMALQGYLMRIEDISEQSSHPTLSANSSAHQFDQSSQVASQANRRALPQNQEYPPVVGG